MVKKLSPEFVRAHVAKPSAVKRELATMGITMDPDENTEVETFIRSLPSAERQTWLAEFVPPQTVEEWRTATDVEGLLSNRFVHTTKARGPTLVLVDNAYKAWINGDITHPGNAENLANALATYRGFAYKMSKAAGQFNGMSKDHREERDRDGVMSNVHEMVNFIWSLDARSRKSSEDRNRKIRRRVLTLFANIDVKWQWGSDLLGAVGIVSDGIDELDLQGNAAKIVQDIELSLAGAGGAFLLTKGVYNNIEKDKFVNSVGQKAKAVAEAFWKFLKDLFSKFIDWAAEKITNLISGDRQEILSVLSSVMGTIFEMVTSKSMPYLSSATDILSGLDSLVTDAWLRSKISAQKAALVTTDGAFAIIRGGIEYGIALRQAVAAWTMTKGVVSIAVTATTAAGDLADLILSALEFGFKMAFSLLESRRINHVLGQARTLFSSLNTAAPAGTVAMPGSSATTTSVPDEADVPPKLHWNSMPPFKASDYTFEQFLNNSHAAYLHFLHSLINASPIMASICMNSGVVKDPRDVFHPATPRSTTDGAAAMEHIRTLKGEAEKLYSDSSFKVLPNLSASLSKEDDRW